MRPGKPDPTPQSAMFRESLAAILDPRHELLRLAARIDWDRLDALYGATFVEHVGRPGLPTRLMLGLHLIRHMKGLSDEAVCAAWVENPYFQAFCFPGLLLSGPSAARPNSSTSCRQTARR